jgi:hypothetical protein
VKQSDIEAALRIDRNALDEMLIGQSQLFWHVSEEAVEAAAIRDGLKDEVTRLEAQLDSQFRIEADASGTKVTEAGITRKIQSDPRHSELSAKMLSAKAEADMASAVREAVLQRSHMLRDLVQLYSVGYWADASVRGNSAKNDLVEERRQAITNKRKRLMEDRANG